jgi:hypothetical protein
MRHGLPVVKVDAAFKGISITIMTGTFPGKVAVVAYSAFQNPLKPPAGILLLIGQPDCIIGIERISPVVDYILVHNFAGAGINGIVK